MFIHYESVGGNKIRITSIEPPQKVIEIAEKHLQSKKGRNSRQNYSNNRKYLLDYIINSYNSNVIYLPVRKIVDISTSFQSFYYEYCSINFSSGYSTKEEFENLGEFVNAYEIKDKYYLIDIMEMLNEILYNTVFNKKNIYSWASKRNLTVTKVLYQNNKELDNKTATRLENTYFMPIIKKGIPAKFRTKLANMNFIKENRISYYEHEWFYYVYKFTKNETIEIKTNAVEYNHNKTELSAKVLSKLESKAVDLPNANYHNKNAKNFQEIMKWLKI